MPRTFAYVRVSTTGQTTQNKIQEIQAAGLNDPRRIVSETVSGSSAIEQRPGFIKLLNKLEHDDVRIVTKLDRLRLPGCSALAGAAASSGSFPRWLGWRCH